MPPVLSSAALALALVFAGCARSAAEPYVAPPSGLEAAAADTALFAGGCFWCMEAPFEKLDGVAQAVSGFTGGRTPNPTYDEVGRGGTGHTEAVQVVFDSTVVSYEDLLAVFWRNVDPFDAEGQFCDRGDQYRAGVFYRTPEQREAALASKAAAEAELQRSVVTEVTAATAFTPAEAYHQDFYKKNPARYYSYRRGCRRDARLAEVWGSAPAAALPN